MSGDAAKSPLLHAWHDPLAGLKGVNSACVKLADLNCDGDSKLCVCDRDKKLKVYKGTSLMGEYAILDTPVAMAVIHIDYSMPRIPSLAIAAGSHVFVYRQLRPYRKWSCPPIDISQMELDLWRDLQSGNCEPALAIKCLTEARDSGKIQLSSRSHELLSHVDEGGVVSKAATNYIDEVKDQQFVQLTLITCMDTVKKEVDEPEAVSLLVVGTESGQIYILPQDPSGSNFICKVQLPSAATLISVNGVFDVEWRVSVTCRDGKLYSIKNGDVRGQAVLSGTVVDLGAQAVVMAKQDKYLWIATMERLVSCYSNRGKRIKGLVLTEDISEMCVLHMKRSKVGSLLLIALATGEMCIYRDLTKIHSVFVDKPISALCYGSYGREENSLVVVHGQGALTVKIWKRAVDAEAMSGSNGPPPEQDIPLPVPKKTKLYVEQTQRERDHAPSMHRGFQRDLCKMRLTTARAYVKTLTDGFMGVTPLGSQDIRIQVQVQGLGPKFLLKISLQNGSPQPITNSVLLFSFDSNLYVMGHDSSSQQSLSIPVLLPGPKHCVETHVMSVDPQGRAGQVLLLLYSSSNSSVGISSNPNSSSCIPMLSASVRMPTSEPLL
jgi:Bardet-Biedl syndrome 1 protein